MADHVSQCQGFPGAGHGHVVKAACGIRILSVLALPLAVENKDVIEFEALGPVRAQEQQAGLPPSAGAAPFGQPVAEIGEGYFRVLCFFSKGGDGFLDTL